MENMGGLNPEKKFCIRLVVRFRVLTAVRALFLQQLHPERGTSAARSQMKLVNRQEPATLHERKRKKFRLCVNVAGPCSIGQIQMAVGGEVLGKIVSPSI